MQERYPSVAEWSVSVFVVVLSLTCTLVVLVMNCYDETVEDEDVGMENKGCCRKNKTKNEMPETLKPKPGTKEHKIMKGMKIKKKDPDYATLRGLNSDEIFLTETGKCQEKTPPEVSTVFTSR